MSSDTSCRNAVASAARLGPCGRLVTVPVSAVSRTSRPARSAAIATAAFGSYLTGLNSPSLLVQAKQVVARTAFYDLHPPFYYVASLVWCGRARPSPSSNRSAFPA